MASTKTNWLKRDGIVQPGSQPLASWIPSLLIHQNASLEIHRHWPSADDNPNNKRMCAIHKLSDRLARLKAPQFWALLLGFFVLIFSSRRFCFRTQLPSTFAMPPSFFYLTRVFWLHIDISSIHFHRRHRPVERLGIIKETQTELNNNARHTKNGWGLRKCANKTNNPFFIFPKFTQNIW